MKRVSFLVVLMVVLTLFSGRAVQAKSELSPFLASGQPAEIERSNLENLTTKADLILLGTVTNTSSHWNARFTSILTDVTVSVENIVGGSEPLAQVMVVVEGGQVGDLKLSVSGVPKFQVNERTILFLKRVTDSTYSLIGGQYGAYSVNGDKVDTGISIAELIGKIQQIMTSHGIPIPLAGGSKGKGPAVSLSPQAIPSAASQLPAPVINSIMPSSGAAGNNTQIVISGNNFGASQVSSNVTFYYKAGQPRIKAPVDFWSNTSIVASVPVGIINGYDATASSGQVLVSTPAGDSNNFQFAVTFSYERQKWSATSPVVHYRVNPNAPAVVGAEEAVQAAAQTWSTVSTADFHFVYDGATAVLNPSLNGVNEIMWGDLGADGPLASTSSWQDSSNNMLEFDIEFNTYFPWSATGATGMYDIQTIATHEMGHGLGLRDLYGEVGTPNDTAKVMYGRAPVGEIKRNLTASEITGIGWIYPVALTTKLGEGGFGPSGLGVNPVTNLIYVGNSRSNNVSVIDGLTNNVVATVSVGSGPQGIAVNPTTNRIYVSNSFGSSVSVIDGASNNVVGAINVGNNPFRLGVNPTDNRIYVANYGSDTVSVIDGVTNNVISTVKVGNRPSGVGVNPNTNFIYVSNDANNNVSVIDGASNLVVATVNVGNGPGGVEVNPANNHIYVANYGSNSISVIEGVTNTVIATTNVGVSPRGVAVNVDSNRIYVADSGGNNVSVIDGTTNSVVSTVGVETEPFGIGVNASTKRIYVANYQNNAVSVIDGDVNSVVLTVKIGSGPDAIAVNSATNRVYVADNGNNSVAVIDASTNSILTTLSVGSQPTGIGLNSITNRIYVASSGSGSVSVIDDVTNNLVSTVNVGSGLADVAVNPSTNRIYVADNSSSSVSVIDGATNSLLTTIDVGFLPLGVAVNPSTNRIYVANNGSNTVSVIDGASNSVVVTVNVGTWPFGLGVNPITNRIYVANNGSNNVSVIDGISNNVVATDNVGASPRGIGMNTITNRVYVANNGDNSVSVIDGSNNIVVATRNVGKGPRNLGVFPATNQIWVTNYWADNVSIMQDVTPSAGPSAKLSFIIQPSAVNVAGRNFVAQPVVALEDSNGNVVTDSFSPVSLNITAGTGATGAVLSGTKTVNVAYGIGIFNDLSINLAGKGYTLTATSGNLTTAISTIFNVVHPGDANGDGVVDMTDVVKVERVILGLDPPTPGADANGDGTIDMSDVVEIERIILGLDPLRG